MALIPSNLTTIVFYVFITIDMILTYKNMGYAKRLYPRHRAEDAEVNIMARWFWKRFGLKFGSIISYILAIIVITIALNLIGASRYFVGFLMGMYYVIFLLHIHNWRTYRQRLKETGK